MSRIQRMFMGRYLPGRSPAHRLDTRIKVLMIGLYSMAIWSVSSYAGLGLMVAVAAGWALLARGSATRMLAPLHGMTIISLFVLTYYVWTGVSFSGPGWSGEMLQALSRSVFLLGKIALILVVTAWLYLFTPPLKVVDALGALLSPLERLKIPVREFSFTVGLILHFFPEAVTRIAEFYRLLQLRENLAGAADNLARKGLRVVRRVVDTMVLYMHYSLHTSQLVALSLLARGYNPFRRVERVRPGNPAGWEYAVMALSCGVILVASLLL